MAEVLLLMWLADASPALSWWLGIGGLLALVLFGIFTFVHYADKPERDWDGNVIESSNPKPRMRWAVLSVAAIIISECLPSKQTLHLAAAAKAAQLASQTEMGTLAADVMKQALQRLKSSLKGDKS